MRRTPTPLSALSFAALALGAPSAGAQCVPFVQLQLDSFAPASAQRLGTSVAIEGDLAAIGGVYGVYILSRQPDGRWSSVPLVFSKGVAPDDLFGVSTALSSDTLVIGASLDDTFASNAGSVSVYEFDEGDAVLIQLLNHPSPGANDWFGRTVAIDADTIAVASPSDDDFAPDAGSVSIFVRIAGVWIHQQTLSPPDPSPMDAFGTSISLKGDTLAVGAPGDDTIAANAGAVFVYTRVGAAWSLTDLITAADASVFDSFGQSVDLDGDSMGVGAWADDDQAPNAGSVYVLRRIGGLWIEQQKLVVANAGASDMLGASVTIEGALLVAGAVRADTALPDTGAAFVFRRTAGFWSEIATIHGAAPDAYAGAALALDLGVLLVGAPFDDGAGEDAGHAESYDLRSLTCPADLDLNCAVGVSDVTTFLAGFGAELPWADTAPPLGVHDFADVMAFLSDFTLGCP